MKICNFYLFSMLHHLDARMRTAAIRTGWRNGKMTFFFFWRYVLVRVDVFNFGLGEG